MVINKGNSELVSRVPHINEILSTHKPSILVINELNLHHLDNVTKNLFPGYKLLQDSLSKNQIKSRTGMLVDKNLKFTRRNDLESPDIATIWIQLKQPKKSTVDTGPLQAISVTGNKFTGNPLPPKAQMECNFG